MKFRVTNITKKPGSRKGPHKNGFFVDVKPKGKIRPMWVGHHVDVDEVTPGMIAMQDKGYISIEPIKDLNVQIKNQIAINEQKNEDERIAATEQEVAAKAKDLQAAKDAAKKALEKPEGIVKPSSGLDKAAMKEEIKKSQKKPKVTISGDGEDPLGDLEEAVNPDGEPSFVVKATKRGKKNK